MDITNFILEHDWNNLIRVRNQFSYANCMYSFPVKFYERGDESYIGQTISGTHGYISNVNIEFCNKSTYSSHKNKILNYHYIPNVRNNHGVVAHKQPVENFCCNSFVSSGYLSGCIVCFLVFKKYVLFIHEGGEGTSTVQPKTKNEIGSRCYDIWRAICNELNCCNYFDASGDVVITGERAIDWLIQRIESIDEFLFGSMLFSSNINAGINGLSKTRKLTFLNYNYHTEKYNLNSQMLCIAHREYIGICSMFWDQTKDYSHGFVIETTNNVPYNIINTDINMN